MKVFKSILPLTAALVMMSTTALSGENNPANLNDLEIAHVAYTADNIDIRYAHLALAISKNPAIHDFAKAMIRDHNAVNQQALALLQKLKASPVDNFLSKQLSKNSIQLVNEMKQLTGPAFDKRYAANELAYHQAVNNLLETAFIPNIENAEVKALFKTGLGVFKAHEIHAEQMVASLAK